MKCLDKHEFSGAAEYLLLIALPLGLFFMRLFLAENYVMIAPVSTLRLGGAEVLFFRPMPFDKP